MVTILIVRLPCILTTAFVPVPVLVPLVLLVLFLLVRLVPHTGVESPSPLLSEALKWILKNLKKYSPVGF